MTAVRCSQIKSGGTACKASACRGPAYCFIHAPAVATERTAARSAGGRKRRVATLPPDTPDLPLRNVDDVVTLLAQTINWVRRGDLDSKVANSVGDLSGIMLNAMQESEIEARFAAVEAVLMGGDRV